MFQLFPYTSFRHYWCWKNLLLISWSSVPCLRDDKIWLGLYIYSSCGKHNPIVWNNMEKVIETKWSKVSQNLSLALVNGFKIGNTGDWSSLFIYRTHKENYQLCKPSHTTLQCASELIDLEGSPLMMRGHKSPYLFKLCILCWNRQHKIILWFGYLSTGDWTDCHHIQHMPLKSLQMVMTFSYWSDLT